MEETLLFPSPNWFLVSIISASKDGWIIYGGQSRAVTVLEPLNQEGGVITGNQRYRAHVAFRAHNDRVTSVDISPEFLEKRTFISGGADGTAKQWVLEEFNDNGYKIKSTHFHDIHHKDKEEIVGVGYSTESIAITVGAFGNIVRWDINSNVCKATSKLMVNFKPTCMACSPHVPLNVAVGTKQGIVFVLDLTGEGSIVYKVRSQDDEISYVGWCPQYEVMIKKALKESENRSSATARLEAIRNEPEKDNLEQSGTIKKLPDDSFDKTSVEDKKVSNESLDQPIVEEDDMFDIYKDHQADEFGHKKYQPENIVVKIKEEKSENSDYLAECLKLKKDILKRKNEVEPSIEALVEAMDKTHVNNESKNNESEPQVSGSEKESDNKANSQSAIDSIESVLSGTEVKPTDKPDVNGQNTVEKSEPKVNGSKTKQNGQVHQASVHVQKHLLATIGKYGGVRVWSKAGKLVTSCGLMGVKLPRHKATSWPTLLWYTPDNLLLVDSKGQLLECNPLQIDCKNKLDYRVVHSHHRRGLFALASDAPRVQKNYDSPESSDFHDSNNWSIYSVAQDRNIIRYSMKNRSKLATHNTCGGYLYNIHFCPYDATKMAISVGDGAIRVWRSSTASHDDSQLSPGVVQSYWQNVQGKVLCVAWHPTKENLLAFGTGENRVGLLDIGGRNERAARVLCPALTGPVYSLCWADNMQLMATGAGHLLVYDTRRPDDMPYEVDIVVEGQKWPIGTVSWNQRGLLCGSNLGAVAVLDPVTHATLAVAFLYKKMIHMMEWHPLQTSHSSEESPYKNLIAVCSLDKNCNIIILEYKDNEGGGKELSTFRTLSGHTNPALQIAWNPHKEELLLSTSQDTTVRVWDAISGTCLSIFGNHAQVTLGAAWLALPQLDTKLVSGGGDCCLRLWDYTEHPAQNFEQLKHQTSQRYKRPEIIKKEKETILMHLLEADNQLATQVAKVRKASKKYILPITHKQMHPCDVAAVRKMFLNFTGETEEESKGVVKRVQEIVGEEPEEAVEIDNDEYGDGVNFINIFGSINDVNKMLDMEAKYLLKYNLVESWITLSIFRGQVDSVIQFASQAEMLCPYLVSMAPCVSFKYWKDATQLYITQIDRLVAKDQEHLLCVNRHYGGAVYKKVTILLSVHDVKGAVDVLVNANLFKEAYILCRIRYMESIAEETLKKWARYNYYCGNVALSAICFIALGDLSEAATLLAKIDDQEMLCLAADIAKVCGRATFADHVQKKAETATVQAEEDKTETLEDLPSRIELLMNDVERRNASDVSNVETDEASNYESVNGSVEAVSDTKATVGTEHEISID